ncbi:MAG: prolyl oligopeptidase family serine peptidase [Bacteroidota bacterium]
MKTTITILLLNTFPLIYCYSQIYSIPELPVIDSMSVTESIFDTTITDPYRGIENLDLPEVKKWYEQQSEYSSTIIANTKLQDSILNSLKYYQEKINYSSTTPIGGGDRLFWIRRERGKANKLLMSEVSSMNEIELLSLDSISSDSVKYRFSFINPSPNGQYVILGIAKGAREMAMLSILDVNNLQILPERIPRTLLGFPQWSYDNEGFFYHQFQETDNPQEQYFFSVTKYHQLDQSDREDKVVFSHDAVSSSYPLDFPFIRTFPNTDYVLGAVYEGVSPNPRLYIAKYNELQDDTVSWQSFINADDQVSEVVLDSRYAYLLKYSNNSKGELQKIDLNNRFKEVNSISATNDTIYEDILSTAAGLYLLKSHKSISYVDHIDENLSQNEVRLPVSGTLSWRYELNSASYNGTQDLFFRLESWIHPPAIHRYAPDRNSVSRTDLIPNADDPILEELTTQLVDVEAEDGSLIPLSIIRHKDLNLNGINPTVLQAYGSYGVTIEPRFNKYLLYWLEKGGIYAVAHVRGGSAKGNDWYEQGHLLNKENSWKDYIACAKHLINNQYSDSQHLAGWSSSAGAITVGKAITTEPELFQAAVIEVGFLNPLRHEQTPNNTSESEFGSVSDSIQFYNLLAMDPYMSIDDSKQYPSMLLTAGKEDDRVSIWQPGKMAARLQAIQGANHVLFSVKDAGHFGGGPKYYSELFTFLFWQLSHPVETRQP